MPGLVDYYRSEMEKLDEKTLVGVGRVFDAAALVGGDEMAKIIAPYLFDERPAPPSEVGSFDIVVHFAIRHEALWALRKMRRPGDPDGAVERTSMDFREPEFEKWRKYVVKEGFVDPSIVKKFPAAAPYFGQEKPADTPSKAAPASPPTSPNGTPPAPATPALTATAATPTRKLKELTTFDIVVFSIFGLAAAVVIFFGLRARKRNE